MTSAVYLTVYTLVALSIGLAKGRRGAPFFFLSILLAITTAIHTPLLSFLDYNPFYSLCEVSENATFSGNPSFMTLSEFMASVPKVIHHPDEGTGILEILSYQLSLKVLVTAIKMRDERQIFGSTWEEVHNKMIEYLSCSKSLYK